MSDRPVIGVIPLIDYNKSCYWMLPGYFGGIIEAGGMPVMLPLISNNTDIDQITDMCNGFLFTGGQDVDPKLYSARKIGACGECSSERDIMEGMLLKRAMKSDKPILGICRGIQFINAALGGTLWQDIPSQFSDTITHCQQPPYDVPIHEVKIKPFSPLKDLLQKDYIPVNSYHHQGVRELSSELLPMATSPDGLIEAVYAPKQKFLWAVQWHPEFSYLKDENSRLIFMDFVKHC
ncbi:MAG: gamma-glutamyl-gamma-aminobutyrate hydrolase family protein [Ruminococcus sp.]|uniref:gamma-glutamyl-gamma-aminobutyrate hydrolase family protein n=1 Tax=Ruminococcus sp. TaxID=41978 RepID=UPI001B262D52|nr:gamma-glutamyl-gamma-aminobutyrate hydrolase family protein [Ruminococcus sp.]MBO7473391.1 gamma-glutamyl-gamma-aminobutyrate hydrolase family protein [Ruminococcus sp.]